MKEWDPAQLEARLRSWERENQDWGISLSPEAVQGFGVYLELLQKAGRGLNLTGIKQPGRILTDLFRDSLCLLKVMEPPTSGPVLDLGSGAGIPGLPLLLARPALSLWLLEATAKKAAFLSQATGRLGLASARVLEGRAEDLGHLPQYREKAALVVSRSVGHLPELLELGLPFLAVGGLLVAWKGSSWPQEAAASASALTRLGGVMEKTVSLPIPGCEHPRVLVFIKKTQPTPPEFPRRTGVPHRKPL